jgi:hypothetical protein
VLSLAGLGLIGVGAHAAWTTQTTSAQTFTSAGMSVILNGPAGSVGDGTASLTLPPISVNSSSFTTGDQLVTSTNNGTIPAYEDSFTVSSSYTGPGLYSEMYVCITSTGIGVPSGYVWVGYNGPLSGVSTIGTGGSELPVGATDNLIFNFYAGTEMTNCGSTTSEGIIPLSPGLSVSTPLDNTAMNQIITVTNTFDYGES